MATKRNLYRPAPKTNVGEKKTRKPLIQGRLVADSGINSDHIPQLAQGQLISNNEVLDPTISPMKSVPVLTEKMSPRPEPPSRCLDLSDADFDGSELSEAGRPRPVMVFDASHLGSSPLDTEVEVVVGYEASPARVFCHTPGKLERSFRESSMLSTGHHGEGDIAHWAVKVDRVPRVSSASKSGSSSGTRQKLFPEEARSLKQMKEASNRANEENEQYISGQSRGIIEEILSQELGGRNVDSISLHSETISPSPPRADKNVLHSGKSHIPLDHLPSSGTSDQASPFHLLPISSTSEEQKSSPRTYHVRTSSPRDDKNKKSKNVNFKTNISHCPQPKFDEESDNSTDRIPVKEKRQQGQAQFQENSSESETCSLYEYVTPRKAQGKQTVTQAKESPANTKLAKDLNQTKGLASARKKKATRVVQSRYMQVSSDKSGSSMSKSSEPSHSSLHSKSANNTTLIRHQRETAVPSKQGRKTAVPSKQKQAEVAKSDTKPTKLGSGKTTGIRNTKVMKEKPEANIRVVKEAPEEVNRVVKEKPEIQSLKFIKHEKNAHVNEAEITTTYPRTESPVTAFSESTRTDQKTSTPTHGDISHLPNDIDASAIHSVSAMSMNISNATIHHPGVLQEERSDSDPSKRTRTKTSSNRPSSQSSSATSVSSVSQLQLDLEYTRYLQWAFLNSKAKKVLQEQENSAVAQIHGLWKLLESERDENAKIEMDVARLKRINLIDSMLEKSESDLDSLISMIPQLEEDYTRMSSALDTTRHQLPTVDVYIPQDEDEKDEYEEKLERALEESERLLAEIGSVTGSKALPLNQYLHNMEVIDRNVSTTNRELKHCQKDLLTVQDMSTRLSSLYVQDMQSQ